MEFGRVKFSTGSKSVSAKRDWIRSPTAQPEVELSTPYLNIPDFGSSRENPKGLGHNVGLDVPATRTPLLGDGPNEIDRDLGKSVLSRLRSKDIATSLTQALAWYGLKNSADLTAEAVNKKIELLGRTSYDPNSLPSLLNSLSKVLKRRHDLLDGMYQENGLYAITNPTSVSTSQTTGGQSFNTNTKTEYTGQEFSVPPAENTARYLRAEISLRHERLAAFRLVKMNSHDNVEYTKALTAADIRKIQLDYIDTFLVAPFSGVVTAVFRNVGEYVTAGQPVLRLVYPVSKSWTK